MSKTAYIAKIFLSPSLKSWSQSKFGVGNQSNLNVGISTSEVECMFWFSSIICTYNNSTFANSHSYSRIVRMVHLKPRRLKSIGRQIEGSSRKFQTRTMIKSYHCLWKILHLIWTIWGFPQSKVWIFCHCFHKRPQLLKLKKSWTKFPFSHVNYLWTYVSFCYAPPFIFSSDEWPMVYSVTKLSSQKFPLW